MSEPIITDSELRAIALKAATDVSLQKGDADGQTVIRRASAFYKFLTNSLDTHSE